MSLSKWSIQSTRYSNEAAKTKRVGLTLQSVTPNWSPCDISCANYLWASPTKLNLWPKLPKEGHSVYHILSATDIP